MKSLASVGILLALVGCGETPPLSDGAQTPKGERTGQAAGVTPAVDGGDAPAQEAVTEDTVRFETAPVQCHDSMCDAGTCVRFATVEGWKDKPVCVMGFACNYVTCGTGRGCWVDAPNVVCGASTPSDPDGDAGAPKHFP